MKYKNHIMAILLSSALLMLILGCHVTIKDGNSADNPIDISTFDLSYDTSNSAVYGIAKNYSASTTIPDAAKAIYALAARGITTTVPNSISIGGDAVISITSKTAIGTYELIVTSAPTATSYTGKKTAELTIIVAEVSMQATAPDKVTINEITQTDITSNAITLSWTVPSVKGKTANGNDATITNYTVEYTPQNGTKKTKNAGTNTSITLDGLVTSTQYTISVITTNSAGLSSTTTKTASTSKATNTDSTKQYYFYGDASGITLDAKTAFPYEPNYSNTLSVEYIDTGGANSTNKFLRLTGSGGQWAAGGWGNSGNSTKNLSSYTTLVFWAKSDQASAIKFGIQDPADGNNPPEIERTISKYWAKYTIPFTELDTDGTEIKVLKYILANTSDVVDIDEVYFEGLDDGTNETDNSAGTANEPNLGTAHTEFSAYTLIKQYEFNGTSIDSKDWHFDTDDNANNVGWGNGEAQLYTGANDDNAYIENNSLVIEAKAESQGGKSFTSARLHTHGLFALRYGVIEARIKMPQNKSSKTDVATFPAFWMLGKNFNGWGHSAYGGNTAWPQSGEIDIVESNQAGSGYTTTLGTLHYGRDLSGIHQYQGGSTAVENVTSEYHIYSIRWTSTHIYFYVDNTLFHTHAIVAGQEEFNEEFFFLVNLAIGGPGTAFTGGQTADTSKYSQYMYIDWIRVYQDPNDSSSTSSTN